MVEWDLDDVGLDWSLSFCEYSGVQRGASSQLTSSRQNYVELHE